MEDHMRSHSSRKSKRWRMKKATRVLRAFRRRKPKHPLNLDETPLDTDSHQLIPSPKRQPPHLDLDHFSIVESKTKTKAKHDVVNPQRLSPIYEHIEKGSPQLTTIDTPRPNSTSQPNTLWHAQDLALCLTEILCGAERFSLSLHKSSPFTISPKRKACQDLYVQLVLASCREDTEALVHESADLNTAFGALLIIVSKFNPPLCSCSLSTSTRVEGNTLFASISKLLITRCQHGNGDLQQWCDAVAPYLYQSKEVDRVGQALYEQLQRFSASSTKASLHPPSVPQAKSASQLACAILRYNPQRDTDLELKVGDLVEVRQSYSDGWLLGRNLRSNCEGEFPSNYCVITTHEEWSNIQRICHETLAAAEPVNHDTGLLQDLYDHLAYRLSPETAANAS